MAPGPTVQKIPVIYQGLKKLLDVSGLKGLGDLVSRAFTKCGIDRPDEYQLQCDCLVLPRKEDPNDIGINFIDLDEECWDTFCKNVCPKAALRIIQKFAPANPQLSSQQSPATKRRKANSSEEEAQTETRSATTIGAHYNQERNQSLRLSGDESSPGTLIATSDFRLSTCPIQHIPCQTEDLFGEPLLYGEGSMQHNTNQWPDDLGTLLTTYNPYLTNDQGQIFLGAQLPYDTSSTTDHISLSVMDWKVNFDRYQRTQSTTDAFQKDNKSVGGCYLRADDGQDFPVIMFNNEIHRVLNTVQSREPDDYYLRFSVMYKEDNGTLTQHKTKGFVDQTLKTESESIKILPYVQQQIQSHDLKPGAKFGLSLKIFTNKIQVVDNSQTRYNEFYVTCALYQADIPISASLESVPMISKSKLPPGASEYRSSRTRTGQSRGIRPYAERLRNDHVGSCGPTSCNKGEQINSMFTGLGIEDQSDTEDAHVSE